jgi:hypothetical protein
MLGLLGQSLHRYAVSRAVLIGAMLTLSPYILSSSVTLADVYDGHKKQVERTALLTDHVSEELELMVEIRSYWQVSEGE